jgi:hypothetical protein
VSAPADLGALQDFVARAVRELEPLGEHAEIALATPSLVAGNARLSPVQQLDIYREQFWLRHVAVMEEDFVSLHTLLGHDAFHELSRDYLTSHPPRSFTLRDLGSDLATFLAASPKYAGDALLADLARLEWCFVEAFDAPEAPPLDVSRIAAAREEDWPGATLVLHPSVQRVVLAHPAHEYRAAARRYHSEGGDPPVRPATARTYVVVYRGPEVLHYIDLEPTAFALLDALARGIPLEKSCERAAAEARIDDASALEGHVGAWFQQWTGLGWVSEVRFDAVEETTGDGSAPAGDPNV